MTTPHPLSFAPYDALDPSTDIPDDPRLLVEARDYLSQLEAGEDPDIEDYVRRHPELAEAIRTCLEGLDLIHRSVKPHRPPLGVSLDPVPVLMAEPLGDFRIVRELGRGGMGIVYEAVQSSLGRRVALKVLPFTATLQPRQLQRFLNEAQAAAHLHHPHIVPVFAVGCDRGVHYYAMQLIEGLSLAELLTKLRSDAGWPAPSGTPSHREASLPDAPPPAIDPRPSQTTMDLYSSRLSTEHTAGRADYFRTIARFGLQAAEALAYAHELGIVHRDIKPANLMLDARGKIWVTDFGLAQVRSGADLTQTGDMLGTLRYMSPEQVQGDRALLDQRTDVYSLGATLYELATLQPMFVATHREGLLNQVLNDEPVALRTLNKSIPVELETIITKAVSKSAADRYATAQRLAEDLQRFLSDQPILAQRPTPADHVRKWARRHPATVAATVLVLLAMSIGLLIHNRLIAREQTHTQDALDREHARAAEAEQSFRQAREAVDLLIQIGEEELADKPPFEAARKRLLTAALAYYQDFIAQRSNDPASQQELAVVEARVKGILRELSVVHSLFQVMLIADPDVQKDLHLTAEQNDWAADFQRDAETQRDAMFASTEPFEERKRRLVQFAETQTARLAKILTAAQQERLKQISLQSQRLFAFQEPEVIEALELTADQRRKIRELEFESIFGRGPKPPPEGLSLSMARKEPPDGPPKFGFFHGPPQNREEDERRMREAVQKAVALLTSQQAAKWKALTGPPFQGRTMLFPRRLHVSGGPPFSEPPRGPKPDDREPPPPRD